MYFAFSLLTAFPLMAQVPEFDNDKPATTYNNQYSQTFNSTWDGPKFYSQWAAMEANTFTETDIAAGYLQFVWVKKRIICSKTPYVSPYTIQTDLDYSAGSSRGGVVIRANPALIDQLQEPATGDPGFNAEGIAFYPTDDGAKMIVQFTGVLNGYSTPVKRIQVPKPVGVTSLRNRGTLSIEDFGTSVYVYYKEIPFIRIDLGGKTGNLYTTGTVYDFNMQAVGTFTGMEVEISGKVAIAQRDAALRLYEVTINSNNLQEQLISIEPIGKKLITDPPFKLTVSASSGLPVELKLVSGPAVLSNDTVTLTGIPGLVTISANQSGNSTYYPANEVIRTFYVSDPAAGNVTPYSQDYVDNWVVTDGLGKQLPTFDEVGPKRDNKLVGVFYYIWQGFHGDKVYDITKIIANYPSDPLNNINPAWGAPGAFHFWGEPEQGYYRAEDPWVIRRDLQMLSNAHVDFIYIDQTNAFTYLETVKTLCEVSLQMRMEGIYTPQIVFTTSSSSGQTMNSLYDEFYAQDLFSELWFKWDGKPLILGNFNDPVLRADVKAFFTIKYSWAWTNTKTEPNHWQWVDTYPQDYGWSTDPAVPEQIVVSMAQHPVSTTGSSYHNGAEPVVNANYLTDFTGQGLHSAEQWTRALQVDPPVIMVTQWNEWVAQRFIWEQGDGIYAGRPIKNGDSYFVDAFTEEFNRDMAPMKGGHTDNYYYQLISNIRKYKGMSAPQTFSAMATINLDGDFSEWAAITPVFKDPQDDVMHRSFAGYDPTVQFVNKTGRNDIVESRASYDADNIYFYVKTTQALTPYTDPNWMLLFIDADRNKGTGWEGYDYVVNLGVNSDTETTLKQWDGKSWNNEITVPYKVNGSEMEMSIPRIAVLTNKTIPEFYFHWADNTQQLKDITGFFTDGESAPDRRFNYNFSSTKIETVPQTAYKIMNIPGTIEFEDFDNGGAGVGYADATIGNSGGAYRTDESVDIESKTGGGYVVNMINSNEWLLYTVNSNAVGTITASINYAAVGDGNEAVLYMDGVDKSGIISFPSTGNLTTWASKSFDLQITAGKHIVKLLIKNASSDINLDKIEFTPKNVVVPGNGTGLNRSLWTGSLGGRTWFVDSICSQVDPFIDDAWADVSPGCDITNDFWNALWQGEIESLYSEMYTLYLTVNDMGRVWINDQLVVDAWLPTSTGKTITGSYFLTAGQKVPIKVDFAEKTGDAKVKLEWSSISNSREVVPHYQLYPAILTDGISDAGVANFKVYPNPATERITVNTGQNRVESIRIIDLTGRIVYTDSESFTGTKSFNLSLQKGIYVIKLTGNNSFKTQKLIIK
jgi:hypothetical protein